MPTTSLRLLLVVAAVGLAVGALGGVAAAQDLGDSTIDSNTSVTVNDEGGFAHVDCTGSPTEHECDKSGALDAGPLGIDYQGFNDDSLGDESSNFGDSFVVTVGPEEFTIAFTCDLGSEPPEGNPCPVDPPANGSDDGGDAADERRGDQRSNNRSPDHAYGP